MNTIVAKQWLVAQWRRLSNWIAS